MQKDAKNTRSHAGTATRVTSTDPSSRKRAVWIRTADPFNGLSASADDTESWWNRRGSCGDRDKLQPDAGGEGVSADAACARHPGTKNIKQARRPRPYNVLSP